MRQDKEIRLDCDGDAVLLIVDQKGVACHTGARSCFYRQVQGNELTEAVTEQPHWQDGKAAILQQVYDIVSDRKRHPKEGSYTCKLLAAGKEAILKKIGEEAFEIIIAGMAEEPGQVIYEATDLFYHLLVFLAFQGIPLSSLYEELVRRYNK